MRCPRCQKSTLRPWKGTVEMFGVEVSARGERCRACKEHLLSKQEVARSERVVATKVVARGIRNGDEFRLLRKLLDLSAIELAAILDVARDTVSRWETGKSVIPRPIAFTMGMLYEKPRTVRARLERL